MHADRRTFLRAAAAAFIAGGCDQLTSRRRSRRAGESFGAAGELASLKSAGAWINSRALTEASLKGKVVLVQFWTFTCINWLRTLPYVRAWAQKYRGAGLATIGVHTPEFSFERDLASVRRAAADLRVEYPIAVDSDYAVWRGFNNHYWPALYLFDANGQARYHHFGEGEYAASETMIQGLLKEAGAGSPGAEVNPVEGVGIQAAADWANLKSPETYVGYERTQNFASPGGMTPGQRRRYALPGALPLNHWALEGDWTVNKEFVAPHQSDGRIANRFHARDLHLVMGPRNARPVRFRVQLDGQAPGDAHGVDVDEQGNGVANQQRLYQLIRQRQPIVDRTFQIAFLDADVQAFAFTFG